MVVAGIAASLLALVATTPAFAVEGLDISTPYPAVRVDPGGEVTFPLTVGTTTPEVVQLEVRSAPEGFETTLRGGGFIVDSVFSDPAAEEPPELELEVTVPDDATAGTYDVQVVATSSLGETPLDLRLTIGEQEAGTVSFETETPRVRGDSSETFSWTLTLHNDTAQELTMGLEAVGELGWTVTPTFAGEEQAATTVLAAGEQSSVNVEATAPPGLAAGVYQVGVRATGGDQVAEALLEVEITGSYAMDLQTVDDRLNISVTGGGSTTLALQVVNTGTAELTNVTLTATKPSGWEVAFDPESIASIPPEGVATVNAVITPSSNAVAGDYQVDFSAEATETLDSPDLQIRTTVETSSLWGFVGIALIALVVIGLFLVFRQYGRR
jgi:uncharacterized membrane protein